MEAPPNPSSLSRQYTTPLDTMSSSSTSTCASSPPKRPRLSLQIKAPTLPALGVKSVIPRALTTDFNDAYSPTAFNTLSNAYAAAIESCSPQTARPDTKATARPKCLRLQTPGSDSSSSNVHQNAFTTAAPTSLRLQTPGPFANITPDSPNTAHPTPQSDSKCSSAFPFTFTPPQSAHPQESSDPKIFTFAAASTDTNMNSPSPISPGTATLRRRNTIPHTITQLHSHPHSHSHSYSLPYTHPRSLRSILRNSPLPPRSNITPVSPRRTSLRYNRNHPKRVGYNTPLTQTITTNLYVRSHIDLLAEDSPFTPTDPESEAILGNNGNGNASSSNKVLETAFQYTGNEIKDGGQTPGPYEEMRRRMASLNPEDSSSSSSSRKDLKKRKRREKKRQWVWTIENEEAEEDPDNESGSVKFARRSKSLSDAGEIQSSSSLSIATGMEIEKQERESRESSIASSGSGSGEREDSDMGDADGSGDEIYGSPHSI